MLARPECRCMWMNVDECSYLPDLVMIISVPSSWNLSHSSLVSRRHVTPASSLQDVSVLGVRSTDSARSWDPGDPTESAGDLNAPSTLVVVLLGDSLYALVADSTSFSANKKRPLCYSLCIVLTGQFPASM